MNALAVETWAPACMSDEEWATWRSSGYLRLGDRPCSDCPLGYAAEMRAQGRCNGTPGGVEEDEDVDEHQAAGAARTAAIYAARRATAAESVEVSVAAPCPTCGHREVCRIRPQLEDLDELDVSLPPLDQAVTISFTATASCSHYVKTKAAAMPIDGDRQRKPHTPETRERLRELALARIAAKKASAS
jgi:hypothetical protein